MAHNSDWLPSSREERADWGRIWDAVFSGRKEELNIPDDMAAELKEAQENLKGMLNTPKNERTPTFTITIRNADERLVLIMRKFKRYYGHLLTEETLSTLGLKPKDNTPTPVEAPSKPAKGELAYSAGGIIEINNIGAMGGDDGSKANYGVRIHYGVMGEPTDRDKFRLSAKPSVGSDLPHSVFTRKKTHRFDFSEDRGKAVYFCLRFENSKGQTGPWGTVYEAFVP